MKYAQITFLISCALVGVKSEALPRHVAKSSYVENPILRSIISARVGETGRVFTCTGSDCPADVVTDSGITCRYISPVILNCGGVTVGLLNDDGTTNG